MINIFRPTIIENTIQGINDINEKNNPIVPAVEGIIINKPAINPHIAADFPNSFELNIVFAINKRAIALKT
jgi:hypothetical protein